MKIAVFFGGTSEERDVSIASGSQIVRALREKGHCVAAVDTARGVLSLSQERELLHSGVKKTPPKVGRAVSASLHPAALLGSPEIVNVDIVFLALHGGSGENGMMQGFLDFMEIPYTGSCHQGSANAMDKDVSKRLFRLAGVPTPKWMMLPADEAAIRREIGFPVVIKANKQGSTVGLTVAKRAADVGAAVETAFLHDNEAMAERFVPGRELTVGILDDRALAVGEIVPKCSSIFDYESKYQIGGAEETFPADLGEEQTKEVRTLALRAHRALKLKGYSRIDFRLDDEGKLWCLEANTLPGMTATSLLPQSAAAEGLPFPDLCERICELGVRRFRKGSGAVFGRK